MCAICFMSGAIVAVLPHVPNVPQIVQDLQHYGTITGRVVYTSFTPCVKCATDKTGTLCSKEWGACFIQPEGWPMRCCQACGIYSVPFFLLPVCFDGGYIGLQNVTCVSLKMFVC